MELVFIKLATSIFIVVTLTEISKRINPKLAGVLMGLPLGTGLSVYFVASKEGVIYITDGIPWAIAGLTSSLLFCLGYLLIARLVREVRLSVMSASVFAISAFISSGFILVNTSLSTAFGVIIFLAGYFTNISLIKRLNIEAGKMTIKELTLFSVFTRGAIVGLIVLAITGLASTLGSKWAGVLTSFPSALYALILILHIEDGDRLYPSVIVGFASGVCALAVFFLLCLWLLPLLGLSWGFGLALVFSSLFLTAFGFISKRS